MRSQETYEDTQSVSKIMSALLAMSLLAESSDKLSARAGTAIPMPPATSAAQAVTCPAPTANGSAPAVAASVGYHKETFGPDITLGKNLFNFNFLGNNPAQSGAYQSGSAVVISGTGGDNSYNAQVATTSAGSLSTNWTGEAFGGGGYFQATMSFTGTPSILGGWPSFFANSIEGMTGQAPENVEVDGVEFDFNGQRKFGSGMHHWYAANGANSGAQFHTTEDANAQFSIPAGTDLSQPHTYGFLWVPATSTSQGHMGYFFDGKQVGETTTWNQYTPGQSATSNPYAFLDTTHIVLIAGTGPHNPLMICNIQVWQKSAASDIVRRN